MDGWKGRGGGEEGEGRGRGEEGERINLSMVVYSDTKVTNPLACEILQ